MSSEISKRSGRRPGPTTTREAIAEAARRQFAELGYERTTMRGIASEAGVDPALVVRFHGSKDGLFRDVMALPPMVAEAIAGLGLVVGHGGHEPADIARHRLPDELRSLGVRGCGADPTDDDRA